jgi:hypothetical protein
MANWNTVDEFADWYEQNGFPIRPPHDNAIFKTNNAHAVVLYREGQFQAELYIVDANSVTPEHSHPGVESIIMYLTGEGSTTVNEKSVADPRPYFTKVNNDGTSILFKQKLRLNPNDSHGLVCHDKGFSFFSIEKWPDGISPSSVAAHWDGETTGEIHNKTIEKGTTQ